MYVNPKSQAITAINQDMLENIIEAILDGKYSYACLMTLEAAGYDPLQYIPYRTYNRLQKQRQASYKAQSQSTASNVSPIRSKVNSKISNSKISDIEHVEPLCNSDHHIKGGFGRGRYGIDNLLFWPC